MLKPIFKLIGHGAIDYIVVASLAAIPFLVKMPMAAVRVACVFAGLQLLMSLTTNYPLGLVRKLAPAHHAILEFYIGIVLFFIGLFGFRNPERFFFVGVAVVILAIFFLTDFGQPPDQDPATRRAVELLHGRASRFRGKQ